MAKSGEDDARRMLERYRRLLHASTDPTLRLTIHDAIRVLERGLAKVPGERVVDRSPAAAKWGNGKMD